MSSQMVHWFQSIYSVDHDNARLVCMFVYLVLCMFVYLFGSMFVCLFVCLSFIFVAWEVNPSICPSARQCDCCLMLFFSVHVIVGQPLAVCYHTHLTLHWHHHHHCDFLVVITLCQSNHSKHQLLVVRRTFIMPIFYAVRPLHTSSIAFHTPLTVCGINNNNSRWKTIFEGTLL